MWQTLASPEDWLTSMRSQLTICGRSHTISTVGNKFMVLTALNNKLCMLKLMQGVIAKPCNSAGSLECKELWVRIKSRAGLFSFS